MSQPSVFWWQKYGTLAQMAQATVALLGFVAILLQINEINGVDSIIMDALQDRFDSAMQEYHSRFKGYAGAQDFAEMVTRDLIQHKFGDWTRVIARSLPYLQMGGGRNDYLVAMDIVRALERAGAEVIGPAPAVEAALDVLEQTVPDGAILDINLGGEMAFPVADALLARGVPFVFATGYDAQIIPARFIHVKRCEKPMASEQICAALFGRD